MAYLDTVFGFAEIALIFIGIFLIGKIIVSGRKEYGEYSAEHTPAEDYREVNRDYRYSRRDFRRGIREEKRELDEIEDLVITAEKADEAGCMKAFERLKHSEGVTKKYIADIAQLVEKIESAMDAALKAKYGRQLEILRRKILEEGVMEFEKDLKHLEGIIAVRPKSQREWNDIALIGEHMKEIVDKLIKDSEGLWALETLVLSGEKKESRKAA